MQNGLRGPRPLRFAPVYVLRIGPFWCFLQSVTQRYINNAEIL